MRCGRRRGSPPSSLTRLPPPQVLRAYDRQLAIAPRNNDVMQYKNAGTYFKGKGGDSKRGSSFRDGEIARLQMERRQ